MKKKSCLHKVEKGALIGASALLLSGMAACSEAPNDTLPLTKGASGMPGLPGEQVPYYPSGTVPVLKPRTKVCMSMSSTECRFKTVIPRGCSHIRIHLYNGPNPTSVFNNYGIASNCGNVFSSNWSFNPTYIDISSIAVGYPSGPIYSGEQELTIYLRSESINNLYFYIEHVI